MASHKSSSVSNSRKSDFLVSSSDEEDAVVEKKPVVSSREAIRLKLASNESKSNGPGQEPEEPNLLVCFMNEAVSEDEEDFGCQRRNRPVPSVPPPRGSYHGEQIEILSPEFIARNNISTKKNHVIIPLDRDADEDLLQPDLEEDSGSDLILTPDGLRLNGDGRDDPNLASLRQGDALNLWLLQIQLEARARLKAVKAEAKQAAEQTREKRQLSHDLQALFGLKLNRKLNRQFLTDRNIAQLQVILNYLLTRIEELNEKLVQYLMDRDELVMEQDSLLTDIEDIRKGIDAIQ